MQLNINKFAIAAGGAMGIIYAVCAAFVSLWPDFSLKLFGWLVHLVNVDKFATGITGITFGGFIIGLLQAVIYTYLGALIFGWLHNHFMKPTA